MRLRSSANPRGRVRFQTGAGHDPATTKVEKRKAASKRQAKKKREQRRAAQNAGMTVDRRIAAQAAREKSKRAAGKANQQAQRANRPQDCFDYPLVVQVEAKVSPPPPATTGRHVYVCARCYHL